MLPTIYFEPSNSHNAEEKKTFGRLCLRRMINSGLHWKWKWKFRRKKKSLHCTKIEENSQRSSHLKNSPSNRCCGARNWKRQKDLSPKKQWKITFHKLYEKYKKLDFHATKLFIFSIQCGFVCKICARDLFDKCEGFGDTYPEALR